MKDSKYLFPKRGNDVGVGQKWKRRRLQTRYITSFVCLSICYTLIQLQIIPDDILNSIQSRFYDDPDEFYIQKMRRKAQTTESNGEPSHIRLCRHLLPRFEHALAIETAEKKADTLGLRGLDLSNIPELQIPDPIEMEYLIVTEDEEVCRKSSTPTDSLLSMFSSALLSAAAERFKLNIEYQHQCDQWRKIDAKGENDTEKPFTIQEMLPSDLLGNEKTSKIPMEVLAIKNICSGCITEFEANHGVLSTRNCVLFTRPTVYTPISLSSHKKRYKIKRGKYTPASTMTPELSETVSRLAEEGEREIMEALPRNLQDTGSSQLPAGIVSILPVIKENLQQVADSWKVSTSTDENEPKQPRPGVLVGPSMKPLDPSITPEMIANMGEPGAYSQVTSDDAVVFLHCKKENCQEEAFKDSLSMPFYVFATEIPTSVASISVVVSEDCATYVEGCVAYGEALTTFFKEYYPRTLTTLLQEPSTYEAYARMIAADYLVCPPGSSCMIPALSSSGKSTIVSNTNLVFWLPQLSLETIWNIKFLRMEEVPVMSVASMDFNGFLNKIPPSKIGICRQLRGKLGKWVQDMSVASSAQYKTPILHYVGEADMRFQSTDELPYRLSTTYRWEESRYPTCSIQRMTRERLCYAMADADLDRIFIIGDSTSMNHAQSLWKLLENEDNPNKIGVRDPNFDRIIDCPEEDRTIVISYARNDQLIQNDKPVSIENDTRNCYAYCFPWTDRYLNFDGTTLLIVNTGAHYQTHHQFQYALREFVKLVDSLERVWDVMLYRTTSPGHRDCEQQFTTPFESYAEYAPTVTDEYSWDKFVGFNDYAIKFFHDRAREDVRGYNPGTASTVERDMLGGVLAQPKRMKMEVLNVYPMTVLRRDGHVSGEVCENCQSRALKDCLHYFLPGPLDWWNHMMFSHIQDLARKD